MCLQKPTPISVHQSEDSSFSWRWARGAHSQGRDINSANNNDNKNNTLYSVLLSRYFFNIQKDWMRTLSKGECVSLTESHACLQPLLLRRWLLCQFMLASRQALWWRRMWLQLVGRNIVGCLLYVISLSYLPMGNCSGQVALCPP